jgi:hypothetical protein
MRKFIHLIPVFDAPEQIDQCVENGVYRFMASGISYRRTRPHIMEDEFPMAPVGEVYLMDDVLVAKMDTLVAAYVATREVFQQQWEALRSEAKILDDSFEEIEGFGTVPESWS